jgi:hypothetical protein
VFGKLFLADIAPSKDLQTLIVAVMKKPWLGSEGVYEAKSIDSGVLTISTVSFAGTS